MRTETPQETTQVFKRNEIKTDDELVLSVTRDLQGLDMIISLQNLGSYFYPKISVFQNANGLEVLNRLSKRGPMFNELVLERTYKKTFGHYGFKVLKLFSNFLPN